MKDGSGYFCEAAGQCGGQQLAVPHTCMAASSWDCSVRGRLRPGCIPPFFLPALCIVPLREGPPLQGRCEAACVRGVCACAPFKPFLSLLLCHGPGHALLRSVSSIGIL